jgi:ubiquinol-cytochrome c reductase cytochrome c subunit
VLIALAACLLASFSTSAQAPSSSSAPASTGNAENGKKAYNAIGCWQCHGYSGQGEEAPRLAPNPMPFAAFARYVRTPTADMPPYTAKVLTDAQLMDIYAFLKTIPSARDWKDIPLLNQKIE